MARGWESKSVESQMEDAGGRKSGRKPKLTTVQQEHQSKIESLQLSRMRVLHDLQTACNPRYRGQLEAALAFLDGEIATLSRPD
jgi:hypothetical protein